MAARVRRGRLSAMSTTLDLPPETLPGSTGRDIAIEAGTAGLQTRRIQQAIDDCSKCGGGRVVLLPGEHRSGTVFLRTDVTLHLEAGAVLRGSHDIDDYFAKPLANEALILNGVATALVFAEGARNIAITGEGEIDGSGPAFWTDNPNLPAWAENRKAIGTWIPGLGTSTRLRPRALVLLADCGDVRIEGVTLRDSPAWTLHLLACSRVLIRGMTLRGPVNGSNNDGVDLDSCSDVLMEDCDIETGDDALCLKSTGLWGLLRSSRRILARRCRLSSTTHGFTIGTETRADFEDITLENARIEQSGGWATLTGIGLSMIDGAAIRGVTVRDVTVTNAIAPIQLRLGNAGRGQAVRRPGSIHGLTLENIHATRACGNCLIAGLPGHPLRDVALRDISVEFARRIDPGWIMWNMPELDREFPHDGTWRCLPAHGFFCRHVEGLELSRLAVTAAVPDTRPALAFRQVSGLSLSEVRLSET